MYEDISDLLSAIGDHTKKHHNVNARGHPRNGRIIVNPFRIHYEYATSHHQTVERTLVKNYRGEPIITPEVRVKIAPVVHAAILLYVASVEGFVNLVYELYATKAIRENKDIRKKIAGEKLETKLKMLPVYCPGFTAFDVGGNTWNEFTSLTQFRNKFIHADLINLNYVKILEEDTFVFYLGESKGTSKPATDAKEIMDNPLDFLRRVKGITDAMVREVFSSMNEAGKKQFGPIMNNFEIAYVVQPDGITIVQERLY